MASEFPSGSIGPGLSLEIGDKDQPDGLRGSYADFTFYL